MARVGVLLMAGWLGAGCGGDPVPPAPLGGPPLQATACGELDGVVVDCAGGPQRSPFACVRFDADCRIDVRLETDGPWYRLEGVNGVTVAGLHALADSACGPVGGPGGVSVSGWKKRLAEDLPALLGGVCAPLDDTADLALRDHETGAWVVRERVPATEEKRAETKACWTRHDDCRG
jgi:hypothetical protein